MIARHSYNTVSAHLARSRAGLCAHACIVLLASLLASLAYASGGPVTTHGVIYTRGLVLGPNNQPIFAEFDEAGIASSIASLPNGGELVGELENAEVMSGASYRAIEQAYRQYLADNASGVAQGAQVMLAQAYRDADFGTVDVPQGEGEPPLNLDVPKVALFSSSRSALIRSLSSISDPRALGERGVILFEAPIDLSDGSLQTLGDSIQSVILDSDGRVLYSSVNNIGFRAAYVKPEDGGEGDPALDHIANYQRGDELWGAVDGALIDSSLGGISASLNGSFSVIDFIPPCPGFSFTYDYDIYASLAYRFFDPQAAQPWGSYYFTSSASTTCIGYGEIPLGFSLSGLSATLAVQAIVATIATPLVTHEIPVDVVLFNGEGRVANPDGTVLEVGSETAYQPQTANFENAAPQHLDLDLDQESDWTSQPGSVAPDGATGDAQYVGVWLGDTGEYGYTPDGVPLDEDGNPLDPDLYRLADQVADFEDRGLLQRISVEDLAETDIYVFRQSNGQLIVSQEGLDPEREVSDTQGQFNYRLTVPGPLAGFAFSGRLSGSLEAWQQDSNIGDALIGRDIDAIRPGEPVKIIAINRRTGYMASVVVPIEAPTNSFLDFPLPRLELKPPNLRVQVERMYEVEHGATAGEQRDFLVGAEGSGLSSDTFIAVYTQWLDHDGSPLPEELDGYQARLAQVVGQNALAGSGVGGVEFFPVKPGRHIQLVKLQGDVLGTEHFYVHVSGARPSDTPDFSEGAGTGVLQYRPSYYVPVRVPIYDEAATRLGVNAAAYDSQTEFPNSPVYRWPYRPEMQFSVFDLQVSSVERIDQDGIAHNILNEEVPIIGLNDQGLNVLYDLLESEFDPLAFFGPDRELAFSLLGSEIFASAGEGQQIGFNNFGALSEVQAIDLVTLSLLQNSDAYNRLWEFSAIEFAVSPREQVSVSADEQGIYLTASAFYFDGQTQRRRPVEDDSQVTWEIVQGNGQLSQTITNTFDGIAVTRLETSTVAGETYQVEATLRRAVTSSQDIVTNFKLKSDVITVVAGAPAEVQIEPSKTEVMSDGTDTVDLEATVLDAFGNPVADDTPVAWGLNNNRGQFVTAQEATAQGKVTATVRAPIDHVAVEAALFAGAATGIEVISSTPITGTLTGTSPMLDIGADESTTVTASVNAVDGTPVFWTTSNGTIAGASVVSGGTAAATLSATDGMLGTAVVTATIGGRLLSWETEFTTTSGLAIGLEHRVLVAGEVADGEATFERPDGTVTPVPFWVAGKVNVKGPAGAVATVSIPGAELDEAFTFDLDQGGVVVGDIGANVLELGTAVIDSATTHTGAGALLLDGGDQASIQDSPQLHFAATDQINVGLWVRPAASGGTLIDKGSWGLALTAGGAVTGTVQTSTGTHSITTPDPIALNEWSFVSLQRDAEGHLRVGANSVVATLDGADGTLVDNALPAILGAGFVGHLDDLSISDELGGLGLVSFDGVDGAGKIQLDGAGEGSFTVRASSAAPGVEQSDVMVRVQVNPEDDQVIVIVEKSWWTYVYDPVLSFFGGDPQTGAGVAANVAGGVLIVGDVGALVKNLWRTYGSSDKEPNVLETMLSGAGLLTEIAVGAGEILDVPISIVRALVARLGDTAFTRAMAGRMARSITDDIPVAAAERQFLEVVSESDPFTQIFNRLVTSDETYDLAIRAADKLGDDFYRAIETISTQVGEQAARTAMETVGRLSDEALDGLKVGGSGAEAAIVNLGKVASQGLDPATLQRVLDNGNVFSSGYSRANLLDDLGLLIDDGVTGITDAVNSLKQAQKQVLGNRYEIEGAAWLSRMGENVTAMTMRIYDEAGELLTDIDVVVEEAGQLIYYQFKRSNAALNSSKAATSALPKRSNVDLAQEWVAKALSDLGTTDYSRIRYAVPDGVTVPAKIQTWFDEVGVVVERIPHIFDP